MNKRDYIPQVETDQVSKGAQKARYTAYLQRVNKLEQKVKADKANREKAARMGGNV